MTAFANCGFEFLSAIGVFAILGFMATNQGVSVDKVASDGIGLAFIAFPKVFSVMVHGETYYLYYSLLA